jgi:hypothetical protein
VSTFKAAYILVSPTGVSLTQPPLSPQQGGEALGWPGHANSTPISLFPATAFSTFEFSGGRVAPVHATTSEPSIQSGGYRQLSETLDDLSSSSDDDEWHIDIDVYNTSIQVAAALCDKNIPAPHVFCHGPKSVVFDWHDGNHNLYLTIGKCRLWVAVSSASEITTRLELTDPMRNVAVDFLQGLQQSFVNRPLLSYDPQDAAA